MRVKRGYLFQSKSPALTQTARLTVGFKASSLPTGEGVVLVGDLRAWSRFIYRTCPSLLVIHVLLYEYFRKLVFNARTIRTIG